MFYSGTVYMKFTGTHLDTGIVCDTITDRNYVVSPRI